MKMTYVSNRYRRGGGGVERSGDPWVALLRASCCSICFFAIILSSCSIGNQSQTQQPDSRLKLFHVQSARIIMLDNSAEVDGTVQNGGHNPFPFDVSIDATFYDASGNIVGHADGVAEDVFPGMTRPFVLMGQVDSVHYSHMKLAPVSLRERRIEKNLPPPTPVVP